MAAGDSFASSGPSHRKLCGLKTADTATVEQSDLQSDLAVCFFTTYLSQLTLVCVVQLPVPAAVTESVVVTVLAVILVEQALLPGLVVELAAGALGA